MEPEIAPPPGGVDAASEERRLRARAAAFARWAKTADPAAATAPARNAQLKRYEDEVDPDGLLSPDQRARRAESLRKSHMATMNARSVRAKRLAAEMRLKIEAAEADRELAELEQAES